MDSEPTPSVALSGWAGVADATAERAVLLLQLLEELAERGMSLARGVALLVLGPGAVVGVAAAPGRGNPSVLFSRYARAVRCIAALDARITADPTLADRIDAAALREAACGKPRTKGMTAASGAAEVEAGDGEGLPRAVAERPEAAEFGAAFARKPIGEVIDGICDDLEVARDWRRRLEVLPKASAKDKPAEGGGEAAACDGAEAGAHRAPSGPVGEAACGVADEPAPDNVGQTPSCVADPAPPDLTGQMPFGAASPAPGPRGRADHPPPATAEIDPWPD